MSHEDWHARWREGRIGFHEGAPNALLVRFLDRLGLAPGGRIFLPLCGKAEDLSWLRAGGYDVAGCDLSRFALDQVFAREGLPPVVTDGAVTRIEAERLTLFEGDFFDLETPTLGPVDALFDRAAMVALPEEMRGDYVRHLSDLAGPAPILLVTFDYDPARMEGPPFAVTAAEVDARYGATHEVERLSSEPLTGLLADRSGGGLEECWLLTRR